MNWREKHAQVLEEGALDAWEASMRAAQERKAAFVYFRPANQATGAWGRFVTLPDGAEMPYGFERAWPDRVTGTLNQVRNVFAIKTRGMPICGADD